MKSSQDPAAPADLNRGLPDLSLREWEVLLNIAHDSPKHEIASRLCLTEKSVENYQTRIGHKLGLTGAGKLARFARKHVALLRLYYEQTFRYLPSSK